MTIIGLTGNIGSGKTYVAQLFAKKNIPIYNSDERAKDLMNSDTELISKIKDLFGLEAYVNNSLNRKYLADKIFQNKNLLSKINGLVHPVVQKDFNQWAATQKNAIYVLKEAAILIESGAYKQCNSIILVCAPEEIRIGRIRKRDKMTTRQIVQRMANQMPEESKKAYANYLIQNDGIQLVEDQVNKIHKQIIKNIS